MNVSTEIVCACCGWGGRERKKEGRKERGRGGGVKRRRERGEAKVREGGGKGEVREGVM